MRAQDPTLSPGEAYYRRVQSSASPLQSGPNDPPLLQSIRNILETSKPSTKPRSLVGLTPASKQREEILWFGRTVVHSDGHVLKRTWNFDYEGQDVHCACWAWFPVPAPVYVEQDNIPVSSVPVEEEKKEDTFGAFAHVLQSSALNPGLKRPYGLARGLCIFLRDIARIFFPNGDEYTFHLPFLVRKAWSFYPYGVMVQRELETAEQFQPQSERLPTLYSLTHPLGEFKVIYTTPEVVGQIYYGRFMYSEEHWRITPGAPMVPGSTEATSSLDPSEVILWLPDRTVTPDPIAISYNPQKKGLTVWLVLFLAYHTPNSVSPAPNTTATASAESSEKPATTEAQAPPQSSGGLDRRRSKKSLANQGGTLGAGDRDRRTSVLEKGKIPDAAVDGRNAMRIFSGTKPVNAETVQAAAAATATNQPAFNIPQLHPNQDPLGTHHHKPLPHDHDDEVDEQLEEDSKMKPEMLLKQLLFVPTEEGIDLDKIGIYVFDTREAKSVLAIHRPSSKLLFYDVLRQADNITLTPSSQLDVVSAVTVFATRSNVADLLAILPDGSIRIFLNDSLSMSYRLRGPSKEVLQKTNSLPYVLQMASSDEMWNEDNIRVIAVEDPVLDTVTFTAEGGEKIQIQLGFMPYRALTKSCLDTICCVLPPSVSFRVIERFIHYRGDLDWGEDDFDFLANVILDMFLPGNSPLVQHAETPNAAAWDCLATTPTYIIMHDDPALKGLRQPAPPPTLYPPTVPPSSPSPYIAPVLMALHLLAEDIKAYTPRHDELCQMVRLVVRLASVAQRDWVQYWARECPSAVDPSYLSYEALRACTIDQRLDFRPPDLHEFLACHFVNMPKERYFYVHQLPDLFGIPDFSNIQGDVDPCRRTRNLIEIYTALRHGFNGALHISQAANIMSINGITHDYLDTLPLGISLPLREALRKGHYRPPSTAPPRLYQLMGRKDFAMTLFGPDRLLNLTDSYKQRNEPDDEPQQSISKLYTDAYANLAGRTREETTGVSDQRLRHFSDVRFPDDFRLREVETMLRSSRTCVIRVQDRPDASEHDLVNEHQMLIMRVAERTLALPIGRSALTFATVPTAQADSYAVPKIEFAVKILPQGSVLNLDGARLTDDVKAWTDFNNAVAAALRISPTSEGVDGSWIILNKPPELTPHHAGFIFGLGLTGHLRSMLPFQAFGYLAPKHNFTTLAVLLGLSAAHYGTGNETVTQMLSVHTPALLPPNSAELNIPVLTQAAGLMGVGLLYLGTRNRRMARVTLQEITRKDLALPGQTNEHRESYTVTAAFAFGMIMVGKGARSNPADMAFVERLQLLVTGEPPPLDKSKHHKASFDITVTSPAATVALMLMFLRTERQDIADVLHPPRTKEELASFPPYLVMLRTLARSVIMWDKVSLNLEWLYDNLPDFLSNLMRGNDNPSIILTQLDDATNLAYMYTLAGICFGIGLKWAGSGDAEVIARLILLHDAAQKSMILSMTSYDQRIKRFAQKECIGAIQLSMAMVAAGTGDLSVFQRLRVAHGQYHNVRFGTHVATHLSLGLLFLGGGRYTLGNSNAAVACLIAALYPRFPGNAADNRAHPQVFRHLWVLAAEPRCLITRDVDTGSIVGLPIRLRKKDGNEVYPMRLMAPSLLPEIDKIASLEVDSPRYAPLGVDVANNPRHRASMLRDQTMWIKRQPGFLTYEEDMRGMRSLNLHTNVAYLDTLALDFPSELPVDSEVSEHLLNFIDSHAHSMRTVAFAKYLCQLPGRTPRENALFAFSHAALVECLALDKQNMLFPYLSVFISRYDDPADHGDAVATLKNLRAAWNFYEAQWPRFFDDGSSINRSVALRPSILQTALAEAEKRADALSRDPQFANVLRSYLRGEGLGAPTGASGGDTMALARKLTFYLNVYSFPPLHVLVAVRERGRRAAADMGLTGDAQLPIWMALMLLQGSTVMSGDRELPNQRITTRAIDDVIRALTRNGAA